MTTLEHPPFVSIITLTLNPDLSVWKRTLDSIRIQKYPRQKIEHIVMDGGSRSEIINLAKNYGCKVTILPKLRDQSETRKGLGIALAKGEIIAFIEADNPLIEDTWVSNMVQPFIERPEVIGAFSMYNDYLPRMPALTKYCALLGVNDPLLYYLGKSEKMPRFKKTYQKGTIVSENKNYYVVKFTRNNLPTLGDNGHLVRRELIQKINQDPKKFIHVDAFARLLDLGYDTYAVVKNSIIHFTGSNIFNLFRRRTVFKEQFYNQRHQERMYRVFDSRNAQDRWNLFRFVFFSLTFIQPFFLSLRGYLTIREPAWFLHPIVCFIAVLSYTRSELGMRLAQTKSRSKRLFL